MAIGLLRRGAHEERLYGMHTGTECSSWPVCIRDDITRKMFFFFFLIPELQPSEARQRVLECVPVVRAMSQFALLFHYWESRSQVYKRVLMKGFEFRAALFLIDASIRICGPLLALLHMQDIYLPTA